MKPDPRTEMEILQVLKAHRDAYEAQDLEQVLRYYAPIAELVCIGTGLQERYVGFEALKQGLRLAFAQSSPISIELPQVSVSVSGEVAWVAADCRALVADEAELTAMEARLTAVLHRFGQRWLIVQSHFSLPAEGSYDIEDYPLLEGR